MGKGDWIEDQPTIGKEAQTSTDTVLRCCCQREWTRVTERPFEGLEIKMSSTEEQGAATVDNAGGGAEGRDTGTRDTGARDTATRDVVGDEVERVKSAIERTGDLRTTSVVDQGKTEEPTDFGTMAIHVGDLVSAAADRTPAAASEAAPEPPIPEPFEADPPSSSPEPTSSAWSGAPPSDPLAEAMEVMARLRARVRSQVLGRDEVIDLVLVALLADGHVLLEDFPGSGKTTLAKTLGAAIVADEPNAKIADFRRVQFTPDLLPSDVTGVSVFDAVASDFHFRPGPIFSHVLLADEINRTSPKVQSAMLEAMAEKQVTVDNVTHRLDDLFFVIATQNPLDLAGTYPLPVAQLDRFLFKIRMVHIERDAELAVLDTYRKRRDTDRVDLPRVTRSQVIKARRAIDEFVAIEQDIKECLVDISQAIRNDDRVLQGNSTRSLVLLLPALQAHAVLQGRDYVSSDDVQALIPRVFGHRVELAPGVGDLEQVLRETMEHPLETLARSTLRPRPRRP
jgi:MoxR-like ATPase